MDNKYSTLFSSKTYFFILLIGILLLTSVFVGASIGFGGEKLFVIFLALVGVLSATLICLKNERFALYLLIASLPLGDVLKVSFSPSTLLIIPGGLAFLSLGISMAISRRRLRVHYPTMIPAVMLGIWATLSSIYNSGDPFLETRPYWLVIALVFLVHNLLRKEGDFITASWVMLLSLAIAGLYVFISRLFLYVEAGGALNAMSLHIADLYIDDRNVVGMELTFALPLAFFMFEFYREHLSKQLWILICGSLALAGALATLSIGVFIGLCIFFTIIIWLQRKTTTRLQILAIFSLVLAFSQTGPLLERLQSKYITQIGGAEWGTYRVTTWLSAWKVFNEHYIWGLGPSLPRVAQAMFPSLDIGFQKILLDIYGNIAIVPHNIFLSVATETGFPGLVLYLILLLIPIYQLFRSIKPLYRLKENSFMLSFAKILFVSLIIGIVQGMGISVHLSKYLWFFIGCSGSYMLIITQRQQF